MMLRGERVIFTAPMQAEIEQIEVDDSNLGPTEVVIRTHVTVISPGTELANLQGKLHINSDAPRCYPMVNVGYANVGEVIAAGADLNVRPGQRVYSMGNHASINRLDATQRFCVPVPDDLPDERAVFVRLANVSMTTMRTTIAHGGDAVAVVGLGPIGNLAAQVFQACGMRVNALDLSPARRAIAERCGIRDVQGSEAMVDLARQHRLVVEATGSAEALAGAVGLAQNGGEIVMIGAPWGGDQNSVPSWRLTRDLFFRFLTLRSGSEWEIARQRTPYSADAIVDNIATGLTWLADGRLNVEPLITHRLPPAEIQRAYNGLLEQQDEYLGVILDWT
ncbi:MAG: zinc-binding dehydrogenase [Chloroflexi bacterium]|nr:zinc-binding dehydrogenase [Chloroflexota bacterium]